MRPLIPSRIKGIELPPFDPLNRRAAELRAAGHHVISLGQAVPFFPPPASALDAARAAVDTPDVNRYATDQGLPSFRAVLAERLAAAIGEERGTIEDVVEPFLIQQGYLMRTARGRMATRSAWLHFGLVPPPSTGHPLDLFDEGLPK